MPETLQPDAGAEPSPPDEPCSLAAIAELAGDEGDAAGAGASLDAFAEPAWQNPWEDDAQHAMCSHPRVPEMGSAASWSRHPAQEPGAAVRQPRLVGGQTLQAPARGPDAAKPKSASGLGR